MHPKSYCSVSKSTQCFLIFKTLSYICKTPQVLLICIVDMFCLQRLTLHCADSWSQQSIQRDDSVHLWAYDVCKGKGVFGSFHFLWLCTVSPKLNEGYCGCLETKGQQHLIQIHSVFVVFFYNLDKIVFKAVLTYLFLFLAPLSYLIDTPLLAQEKIIANNSPLISISLQN